MASLQERNGSYRILFCYHGKLHTETAVSVEPAATPAKVGA